MKLYKVPEASEMTGLSPATWRAWILRRKVLVVRLGRSVRIPEDEILRLVREGTFPATAKQLAEGITGVPAPSRCRR
jgi:excisionase family DNA binding protein